ncbi:hypothetical protein BH18ACT17_BH18ACT17_04760 [soil metagenome]
MPLQNRVTPFGELIADPARGLVYGNRGCLHDEAGHIRRSYAGKRWIACRLAFKGWHREPLRQPGRFTELFFLDEATAFAAGHRPCALCRRADYVRFIDIWRSLPAGPANADAIDARLHDERLDQHRRRRQHPADPSTLPDGVFVVLAGEAYVVVGDALLRWTPAGYVERLPVPGATATVITPASIVRVLRAGWQPSVPFLHPSALTPA